MYTAIETPLTTLLFLTTIGRVAEQLGLEITGALGVVIRAKLRGIIPSVKPILEKIKTTDFRLTETLEKQALKEAGE